MKKHEQCALGPKQKSFIFFIQTGSQKDRQTDRQMHTLLSMHGWVKIFNVLF
jgi:hypothetical protein